MIGRTFDGAARQPAVPMMESLLMTAKSTRLLVFGLLLVLGIGLIPVLLPRLMVGALAIPTILTITIVALFLIVRIIQAINDEQLQAKRKRHVDDGAVLEAVDQLIDSLDDDQIRYLSDRLDQRRRLIDSPPSPPADEQAHGSTDEKPQRTARGPSPSL